MPAYTYYQDIGVHQCDVSGIVFLPRYFEMMHAVVENWFEEALDWPLAEVHGSDRLGLPLVRISAEFPVPTRLGDRLQWKLQVNAMGYSSLDLGISAFCRNQCRADMTATLVLSELGVMQHRRWPERFKLRAGEFLDASREQKTA